VLLAALAALFLLGTAAFGVLYLAKNSAYDKQVQTVKARDTTIANQQGQIGDLRKQLTSAQNQLNQANQNATGAQNQVKELTREKQVISTCLSLLGDASDAADAGDRTTYNSKMAKAKPVCDEADGYLN
jgi:uncharacterized protein HemX